MLYLYFIHLHTPHIILHINQSLLSTTLLHSNIHIFIHTGKDDKFFIDNLEHFFELMDFDKSGNIDMNEFSEVSV